MLPSYEREQLLQASPAPLLLQQGRAGSLAAWRTRANGPSRCRKRPLRPVRSTSKATTRSVVLCSRNMRELGVRDCESARRGPQTLHPSPAHETQAPGGATRARKCVHARPCAARPLGFLAVRPRTPPATPLMPLALTRSSLRPHARTSHRRRRLSHVRGLAARSPPRCFPSSQRPSRGREIGMRATL